MEIFAEPLSTEAFEPFGLVICAPSVPRRVFFNEGLYNARPNANFDLSLALINPLPRLPLEATVMERHKFSSQTFLPLRAARYLIVVAPSTPEETPDLNQVHAFVATGRQGLTYRANVWHHGLTVLDEPGEFAVLMWCDGSRGDEEFRTLDHPFAVQVKPPQ